MALCDVVREGRGKEGGGRRKGEGGVRELWMETWEWKEEG